MRGLYLVFAREIEYCKRNKWLMYITLLMPSLVALLLFALYYNYGLKDISVAVVDLDRTSLSRSLITANINSSPVFNVIENSDSLVEAQELMNSYKIQAVFVIPDGFSRDLKRSEPVKISVYANSANIIISSMLLSKASEMIAKISGGVEASGKLHNIPKEFVLNSVQPVSDTYHFINNPAFNSNYAAFLVFGMFLNSIMVASMYYPTRGLFREIKDIFTHDHVRAITDNPLTVLLGKTLAYLFVVYPGSLLGLFLGVSLLHIPFNTTILLAAFYTLWFCIICIWIGFSLPVIFNNQEVGFSISAIVFMPSFLISGFTWPVYMMPKLLELYSVFVPFRYYSFLMRAICYERYLSYNINSYIVGLLAWSIIAVILVFLMTIVVLKKESRNNVD